jgi:hypothetical protein
MAKKPAKETSIPLIVALVFFVLTTVTFGVLWYMQYQEQQANLDAVKKAEESKKASAGEAADAQLEVKILRITMGIGEGDVESVVSETARKPLIATKVKQINEAVVKALGEIPDEYKQQIWMLDDKTGMAGDPPTKGLLPIIGDAVAKRKAAVDSAAAEVKAYKEAVVFLTDTGKSLKEMAKKLDDTTKFIDDNFRKGLKEYETKFEARMKQFRDTEDKARTENTKLEDVNADITRKYKDVASKNDDLKKELDQVNREKLKKQDTFQFEEAQGKVVKRLSDDVVEIDLGSDVLVRPGLTFSVLPNDYPEKGRQSRVRIFREPDKRGDYKEVQRFVDKASIEVIEVLGPKRSRARITGEYDKIRDGVGPGDLLYNVAWRKGTADHIALIGIFDINGDGNDDIEAVVKEFLKMGIPVDAYFDMKTRKWKGQIDAQTRFIVQGYYPVVTGASDALVAEKSKLRDAINTAINTAQAKGGAQTVNFRDFFPRMGYKVRVDVSQDKINQAAGPYLKGVTAVETPEIK